MLLLQKADTEVIRPLKKGPYEEVARKEKLANSKIEVVSVPATAMDRTDTK
jgi:hypothetical protein